MTVEYQTKELKIAVIVPALNEEATVGDVVGTLAQSPYLNEIIVISDGSTDNTAEVARQAGATSVYELDRPGGKGQAMIYGVQHTKAPIVVFFDADLRGLTVDHIEQIVLPVISGSRDMNVALRDKGAKTPLAKHLPLIGGERALHRDIIENINPKFMKGYMVEIALNYYCRSHRRPYGCVPLRGLDMKRKFEKTGWLQALFGKNGYIDMTYQVLKAMVVVRIARLFNKF
ncbi:MAG: glycosyltransferase [Patescibacteria group bacterium]